MLNFSVMSDSLRPNGLFVILVHGTLQESIYWSRLLCLPPEDLPDPWVKAMFPALQADSLPTEPPGKP